MLEQETATDPSARWHQKQWDCLVLSRFGALGSLDGSEVGTVLPLPVLHCTALPPTCLYCTVLRCPPPACTALYCVAPHLPHL